VTKGELCMSKKPAKKAAPVKRRAVPPESKPRRAVPPDAKVAKPEPLPVVSDENEKAAKKKAFVENKTQEVMKGRHDGDVCAIFMPLLVPYKRAAEWALYWQSRLGVAIHLQIAPKTKGDKYEYVVIDHTLVDDPFPQRSFNHAWHVEPTPGRVWANPATGKRAEPVETNTGSEAPSSAVHGEEPAAAPPVAAKRSEAPSDGGKPVAAPPRRALTGGRGGAIVPKPGTKAAAIVQACRKAGGASTADLQTANDGERVPESYLNKLAGISKNPGPFKLTKIAKTGNWHMS